MKWIMPLVVILVIAILGGTILFMYTGYNNTEIELRNQAKAQQQANTVVFDKMKKVVFQQAQVASKYADDFKEVYKSLMTARYEGKDPLMNWISEHNPNLDASLYKTIQTSIAGLRAEFATVQNRLIDIKREHNNLLQRIPSNWFVGGRDTLDIQIVTSTETKKIFESGVEDNTDLF